MIASHPRARKEDILTNSATLSEKSRKAPTILVEVPFSKESVVLFLISFVFSNFILMEFNVTIQKHDYRF